MLLLGNFADSEILDNSEFLASFPLFIRVLHHILPKNPNFDSPTPQIHPQSLSLRLCT